MQINGLAAYFYFIPVCTFPPMSPKTEDIYVCKQNSLGKEPGELPRLLISAQFLVQFTAMWRFLAFLSVRRVYKNIIMNDLKVIFRQNKVHL
jgi:hypothetical protein